jgi:hypothetical protein
MVHVDDLVQPGTEHVVLPAVKTLLRLHRITSALRRQRRESRPKHLCNLQENKGQYCKTLQMQTAK